MNPLLADLLAAVRQRQQMVAGPGCSFSGPAAMAALSLVVEYVPLLTSELERLSERLDHAERERGQLDGLCAILGAQTTQEAIDIAVRWRAGQAGKVS